MVPDLAELAVSVLEIHGGEAHNTLKRWGLERRQSTGVCHKSETLKKTFIQCPVQKAEPNEEVKMGGPEQEKEKQVYVTDTRGKGSLRGC